MNDSVSGVSVGGPRVQVEGLGKTFYFYRHPIHRLTHWLTRGRHGTPAPFHALKDVSFTVPAGTSTGIIGVNGAGKSTLLKIITGTMEPTTGSVRLDGRIASLLELGTGFHPLFTGRQNIVYNARFLGLTEEEIQARIPDIEEFSELGEFLDRPLRTYSSGMYVRLAFSVAASVNPDVLVIDEVLSVGDAYFQPKCIRRIRDFRDRGVTILFVSHDPGAVKSLCDRALLLHDGTIVDDAEPARVLEHYNAVIARKKADSDYLQLERGQTVGARHSGTFAAVVSDVDLVDAHERPIRALTAGATATLRIRVFFFEPVHDPTIGFMIRDRMGNEVWGTNTSYWQIATGDWQPGDVLEVRVEAPFTIGPGEYSVAAAVHTGEAHVTNPYDWVDGALVFGIVPAETRRSIGVALLRPEIAVGRSATEMRAPQVLARAFGEIPSVLEMAGGGRDLTRAGWYGIEGAGDEAFRWTAGECSFLLAVNGPEVCVEVAASRPAGTPPVEIVLRSLGRELGRARVTTGGDWQVVRIAVPPEHPPGSARLELLVSECWRPRDTGHGPDPRSLGVCIRRIWSSEPARQTVTAR